MLPVARGGLLVETPLVLGGEGVTSLEDRTVTVNALAKTYADRLVGGWITAAPAATGAIRKVHDFLAVGARGGGTWAKVMAMFTSSITGKTARDSMSVRRGIHA